MTTLTKPIVRETNRTVQGRPIVLTIAPAGSQPEALLGLRLKGKRTQYVVALSDVYRWAAQSHGGKEAAARRNARRCGIPWKQARREFLASQTI